METTVPLFLFLFCSFLVHPLIIAKESVASPLEAASHTSHPDMAGPATR